MNIEIERPRKRLTIVSPLPPRRSGIASYIVELLPHLAKRYSVTIVVESRDDIVDCPGCCVVSADDEELASIFEDSAILYQLANNPDHEFVYRLCVRYPGIVVLHEFVLHHLIESLTLGRGRPDGYFRILEREYGPSGLVLARLRQIGYFCENQKFLMPLCKHVVRRAKSVIVHNEYCARRLGWPFDRHIMVCPHHLSPLALEHGAKHTKEEARRALGLEQNRSLMLSLGFVTRPKRADIVLRALGHLKALGHDFVYMLVGHCGEKRWIESLVTEFHLEDNVRMVDYVEEDDFFQYIAASDIVINLRFPSAGESSGTLTRAMGMGTACVVFDYGPMGEFPDDIVVKVKFVRDERLLAFRLAHRLEEHIINPDLRHNLAIRARDYVRSHCTIDKTLEVYDLAIMRMLDDGEEFQIIEDVEV
ncbi:MAG TPA: glycosyltransferase family 4 protein [Rhizomicrobium sp.]|jgi:glycosyltransferase involved in cell wall biosynthesis|nr:glycosyltransferase family 4 protein [Rhizomicrobium sp.]